MPMDKRAYIHFRNRCEQRFGIVLSEAQVEEIGNLCRDGSYPKIRPARAQESPLLAGGPRRRREFFVEVAWIGQK